MKKVILLSCISFLFTTQTVTAQVTLTNSGSVFITNGGKLAIHGTYVHLSGDEGLSIDAGAEFLLTGDLINQSGNTMTNGYTGKFILNGTEAQLLNGTEDESTLLHDLEIQNTKGVTLGGSIAIAGNNHLQSGSIDLASGSLRFISLPTLDPSRQHTSGTLSGENENRIFATSNGKVLTDHREYILPALNEFVNVAGLGAEIMITGFTLGDIKVERTHTARDANGNAESILRAYTITVHNASGDPFSSLPAALRFHYLDSEIASLETKETNFTLFRSVDGGLTWRNMGGIVDTDENMVTLSNIEDLNGLWTISYCLPPSVSLGDDVTLCHASPFIMAANTDGKEPYTFTWTKDGSPIEGNDSSVFTIPSAEESADYTVAVTDARGCSSTDDIHLAVRDLPLVNAGEDVDICANAFYVFDVGDDFSTYTWTDPSGQLASTDGQLSATTEGTYRVEVTDAFGCSNYDEVALLHKPLPVSNLTEENFTCGNSMLLGEGLSALNPGATYQWHNGEGVLVGTDETYIAPEEGHYEVTISGSNGCATTSETEVVLNSEKLVDLGTEKTVCALTTFTIDAERNNSLYLWSTGETTPSINYTIGDEYQIVWVDVTDVHSQCTRRDSLQIYVQAVPVITIEDVMICENTSALLDAGSGFVSYAWNDHSQNQTLVADTAGIYSVVVTNAFGCSNQAEAEVSFYEPIIVNLDAETISCKEEAMIGAGLADLNAGASFLWSNLETTPSIIVNEEGVYTVTITDAHGCEKNGTTTVVLNTENFVDLGADIDMECHSVLLDAGNPGATYQWSNGESTQAILVDQPGRYAVTVTNPFGCVGSDEINVNLLPASDSAFFLSATEAYVLDTVYFIGLTSAKPASVSWNFGDGQVTTNDSLLVSHIYANTGIYSPALTTVFQNGCENSYKKQVTITEIKSDDENNEAGRLRESIISNITVHPNPNDGIFAVEISLSIAEKVSLSIVTLSGLVIHTNVEQGSDFYHIPYNLMNATPGIYVLTVTAQHERRQFRLVIE